MNMKIFRYIFLVCLMASGWNSVEAQRYDNIIDRTVAVIGGEVIQLSQVESEAQMAQVEGYASERNLRCMVMEQMMESKLFLTQAKLDSLTVNPEMVEANLNQRISTIMSQLGGEAEMEKYFGRPVNKLRQEWRETLNEQGLVQEMQQKIAGTVLERTPKQIKDYYKRLPKDSLPMVSTQYQLSQIAVYPDKKKAEMAVKERLLDFRERIMNGEKFSMLATLYSKDPGSAFKGGELGMMSKTIFWPQFSDAAMSLKVGQVSSIVETPDGFHLIQMIEKKGDMFNARHILLKPEYGEEDRKAAFAKLDSIKTVIAKDSIPFFDAARFFSQDPATRTNGGVLSDPNTGSSLFEKDQLKPEDYRILKDMEVGEISEPFESSDNEGRNGNTMYKIIKFDKIIPAHPANIDLDLQLLSEMAVQDERQKAVSDFLDEKIKVAYIVIDPMFSGCDFHRKGWLK